MYLWILAAVAAVICANTDLYYPLHELSLIHI